MISEFIFCCALPGAGKSTYIAENYPEFHTVRLGDSLSKEKTNLIISADTIKEGFENYDPEHPEAVHEESVQLAKDMILQIAHCSGDIKYRVILDGGGINNHYNVSIINAIRKTNPDAKIVCLFFDTPVEVCINRISKRERKVPTSDIYKKNQKIVMCINRYREIADEFIRVSYFSNKYLLLDMDGTIAAYSKAKHDEDGNVDFVNCEQFRWSQPVNHVIEFVKNNFDMNNVYIVTACPNSIAWTEKLAWLGENFPELKEDNIMFVGNKDWKHTFIKHLTLKMKWKPNEVCLIDDSHDILTKCQSIGINAIHPSNLEALFNPETYQA